MTVGNHNVYVTSVFNKVALILNFGQIYLNLPLISRYVLHNTSARLNIKYDMDCILSERELII